MSLSPLKIFTIGNVPRSQMEHYLGGFLPYSGEADSVKIYTSLECAYVILFCATFIAVYATLLHKKGLTKTASTNQFVG